MDNKTTLMSEVECNYFLAHHAFASLISEDLQITQLPFARSDKNHIECHLAKNNPQLAALDAAPCLLSVLGEHAFIAAENYQTAPAVPTWNYATVSIRGQANLMTAAELHQSIDKQLNLFEPALRRDKTLLPDDFRANLEKYIVGINIEISSINGKLKLGQHRSKADQFSVFDALNKGNSTEQSYAQFAQAWLQQFRPEVLA